MNQRLTAYLALTTTSLIWSIGAVLIKYSLNHTTPLIFLFWRFLIVSWFFFPFVLTAAKKDNLKLKDWPLLSGLGVMATSLTLGVLFWGMSLTSATEAIIINNLAPILIIVGGAIFLREEITSREKIGAGFAFVGSLLAVVQPLANNGQSRFNFTGNILVFLSTIIWAAYSLLARKYQQKKFSPTLLTGTSFIFGFLTITPLFLLEQFNLHPQSLLNQLPNILRNQLLNTPAMLGILYMALAGSCVAYLTYNVGLKLIEASEATIFAYLQPVFAIPLAIWWLGESINPWIIAGSILIIIGIFLTEYKPRRKVNRIHN